MILLTGVLLAVAGCCVPSLAADIDIAWLAPQAANDGTRASSSLGGLALAVAKINGDTSLLPDDTLKVGWQDSDCSSKAAIDAMYTVLRDRAFTNPDVVIGPPCSQAMEYVGELCGSRDIPIFGWRSQTLLPAPVTRDSYNSLVRVLGPTATVARGLHELLVEMSWTLVALVSNTDNEMASAVRTHFSATSAVNITRDQDSAAAEDAVYITDSLNRITSVARIIIMCLPREQLVEWMKAARSVGMTSWEYVYIWVSEDLPSAELLQTLTSSAFYSDDAEAREAFKSLLVFTPSMSFVSGIDTFLTKADGAATTLQTELGIATLQPSDATTPFLHDAVLLWAHLAHEVALAGRTPSSGQTIADAAKNRAFTDSNEWATGSIYLDSNGDRDPDFWIMDMGPDSVFRLAVEFVHANTTTKTVSVIEEIIWSDGSSGFDNRPKATPDCGFLGENCPDYGLYIGPPAAVVVATVIGLVIFFVYKKYQFENSLKDMVWQVQRDDLIMKGDKKIAGSAMLHLSRASSLRRSMASNMGGGHSKKSHHDLHSKGDSASHHTNDEAQIFINTAKYKGNTVAWKKIRKERQKLDREFLVEMRHMTDIKCGNLATFVGACIQPGELMEVWEYCTKGSLQDVIWNDNIKLDDMFKFSIAIDMFKGLKYLHDGPLKCHGNLKSSNCVIDSRWSCKLTDYGLFQLRADQADDPEESDFHKFSRLFWNAPEQLRHLDKDGHVTMTSPEADIYAAAIILKEIFARNGPYTEYDYMMPEEIIKEVKAPANPKKLMRPDLSEAKGKTPAKLLQQIQVGWSERPGERPSAGAMIRTLQAANPNKSNNVMDNMIKMMERYSNHLEEIVQERTVEIEDEKKRSETLLYRMLPRPIAEDLKLGKPINPENYDSVSIYFSDIVSFTKLAGASTPMQVVDLLNDLYTIFDSTIANHDVYKVETIGDAYMYVSGLPIRNGDNHAVEVTNCAMELLSGIVGFRVRHLPDYTLRIRIGLHTGPVVAGVVGVTMPRYCLFGDTVTIASTMESGGMPMRVHMSEDTYKLVSKFSGYYLADRGKMEVKGRGLINTYFVVTREGYTRPYPNFDELAAAEDETPCRKLPVTKGRQLRSGSERPSTESGFYDMSGAGGDTLSAADVAVSRKTSAVVTAETPTLDDIQEHSSNEHLKG